MSTPARRTRAASRQGSAEAAEPRALRSTPARRARQGSQESTGLAPRTSGAYGGSSRQGTAERTFATQGQSGFAAGFAGEVNAAMHSGLSPVQEERSRSPSAPAHVAPDAHANVPAAPVAPAAPPVELAPFPLQYGYQPHAITAKKWLFRILAGIMFILTVVLISRVTVPLAGISPSVIHLEPGSPGSYDYLYTRLYNRLFNDLSAEVSTKVSKATYYSPPSKPPDNFAMKDGVIDHNQISMHYPDNFAGQRKSLVNPLLTSYTLSLSEEQKLYRENARKNMYFFNPARWCSWCVRTPRHGPLVATEKWHEAGECWCARQEDTFLHTKDKRRLAIQQKEHNVDQAYFASHGGVIDNKGISWQGAPRAQLTVRMPNPIYPTHAIIEHIPSKATTDIMSAPEWVEIYANIPDASPELRTKVWESYAISAGEDLTKRPIPEYSDREIAFWHHYAEQSTVTTGQILWSFLRFITFRPAPKDMVSAGRLSLNHDWVRVARGRYDIHAPHVQTVKLGVDFKELGVPVKEMSFRVRSNWGRKDYTCLYRVRMIGEEVDEK